MIVYVTGCSHHHRLRYQADCQECASSFEMYAKLDMHDLLVLETCLADGSVHIQYNVAGATTRNVYSHCRQRRLSKRHTEQPGAYRRASSSTSQFSLRATSTSNRSNRQLVDVVDRASDEFLSCTKVWMVNGQIILLLSEPEEEYLFLYLHIKASVKVLRDVAVRHKALEPSKTPRSCMARTHQQRVSFMFC